MEININHFKLDKFNIEAAALEQPSLYQFYASLLADKQKELDKLNLQYEQKEAQIKIDTKNANPKVTVDMLAAHCAVHHELVAINEQIIDKKHEVATLKTAVSAMEQRRDMIQVESRLQANAMFQCSERVGDHTSAEWAESVLRKQLNNNTR